MSELFTSGSVGGAAGNCCSYPAAHLLRQTAPQTLPQSCAVVAEDFFQRRGIVPWVTQEDGAGEVGLKLLFTLPAVTAPCPA